MNFQKNSVSNREGLAAYFFDRCRPLFVVLALLTFGVPAFPRSVEANKKIIVSLNLEKSASRDRELPESYFADAESNLKTPNDVLELAADYVQAQRIQEAIWLLDENHQEELANALKGKLRNYLTFANLNDVEKTRRVQLREFEDGSIHVMTKGNLELRTLPLNQRRDPTDKIDENMDGYSWRSESWAYELDQIGKFNLVPMVVAREEEGEMRSLQYFVKGAEKAKVAFKLAYTFQYPENFEKLFLFDFLLMNKDRHQDNLLKIPRQWVAIDNAASDPGKPNPSYDQNIYRSKIGLWSASKLKPSFYQKVKPQLEALKRVSEEELYERLGEFAPASAIYNIIWRFNIVLANGNVDKAKRPRLDPKNILTKGDVFHLFEGLSTVVYINSWYRKIPNDYSRLTPNGSKLIEFLKSHQMSGRLLLTFAEEISRARYHSLLGEEDYYQTWSVLLKEQKSVEDPTFLREFNKYVKAFEPDEEILSKQGREEMANRGVKWPTLSRPKVLRCEKVF